MLPLPPPQCWPLACWAVTLPQRRGGLGSVWAAWGKYQWQLGYGSLATLLYPPTLGPACWAAEAVPAGCQSSQTAALCPVVGMHVPPQSPQYIAYGAPGVHTTAGSWPSHQLLLLLAAHSSVPLLRWALWPHIPTLVLCLVYCPQAQPQPCPTPSPSLWGLGTNRPPPPNYL